MIRYDGFLHTHIDTYVHPTYGNRVDVVGMAHFADVSFYDRVQDYLDDRTMAGAHVQYEGLKAPSPGEIISKDVATKATLLAKTAESVGNLFIGAGFVSQQEVLEYRPSWVNHDMSVTDLVARLDKRELSKRAAAVRLAKLLISTRHPSEHRSILLDQLQEKSGSAAPGAMSSGFTDTVLLDERNEIALGALDKQSRERPGTDFVLLWGELHLKGLGIGLSRRNYRMTKQAIVPAIRL